MTPRAAWHARSIEETCRELETDPQRGLTKEEAHQRLSRFGFNELAERPRPTFWKMLLDQFNNFLILILIAAALISLVLGEMEEAIAIIAIVLLNAILGVVQERRAEEALAALKKMAAPDAHVLRDGHRVTIPARELVPGDIVFLEAGNYVPADLRLIEAVNLHIDEASLTGESVAVEKRHDGVLPEEASLGDRVNIAFMGTIVTYGSGKGVVTATGMQTQLGQIAELIRAYEEEATPLQRRLDPTGPLAGHRRAGHLRHRLPGDVDSGYRPGAPLPRPVGGLFPAVPLYGGGTLPDGGQSGHCGGAGGTARRRHHLPGPGDAGDGPPQRPDPPPPRRGDPGLRHRHLLR